MGRVTRREWYARVNAAWPQVVPALTAEEAPRAFRRLYRFAFKRLPAVPVQLTSGNRYTGRRAGAWIVNPDRGWHDLVHVLSHYAERSGHNGKHARMELRLIREVVRRGWLEGTLKRTPRPVPVRDLAAERLERARTAVVRWERKAARADRALRKARLRLRRLERVRLAA